MSRKKTLLWIVAVGGAMIVIVFGVLVLYPLIFGTALERKLAELRKAGEPTCLADLARKPIDSERNGMTYILRAKADLSDVDKELSSLVDDQGNYKPEDMKKIEDVLSAHPNIYPLLEQAAVCEDFDLQMDFGVPPSQVSGQIEMFLFREVARHIDARSRTLITDGDRHEALRSAVVLLEISRRVETLPFILNRAVANGMKSVALECAFNVLASGPVDGSARAELEQELSLDRSMDQLRNAMKTERALSLDIYRREIAPNWIWIWRDQGELSVLSAFEDYLNYLSLTYSGYCAKPRPGSTRSCDIFGEMMRPALAGVLTGTYRVQALVRALRIINALQRKHLVDGDETPTMAELGLPDEVGVDPFSGKAMIIKKLPEGWLVYSVGENLTDDGGKVAEESDNKPLDIGFGPKISKPQSEDKGPAQE